jgi:hypothetical protein
VRVRAAAQRATHAQPLELAPPSWCRGVAVVGIVCVPYRSMRVFWKLGMEVGCHQHTQGQQQDNFVEVN